VQKDDPDRPSDAKEAQAYSISMEEFLEACAPLRAFLTKVARAGLPEMRAIVTAKDCLILVENQIARDPFSSPRW
jgi:hypothetical protein